MDCHPPRSPLVFALLAACVLPSCGERVTAPVESLPAPDATLTAVGIRLGNYLSIDELNAAAQNGQRLLTVLTPAERDALGRGSLRFQVKQAVIIEVAASPRATPFWLRDQGFVATGDSITIQDTPWPLYRKPFPPGWVGLGVNSLDRSALAHYATFVRSESGRGIPLIAPLGPDPWRVTLAAEGVSVSSDADLPVKRLPDSLQGAALIQAPDERKNTPVLARGRVWKTHVASTAAADQVVVSLGADPKTSLAWTWRTSLSVADTELRLAPANGSESPPESTIRLISGSSRVVDTPSVLNDPAIRRHRVLVDDLTPATAYAYSVRDGSKSAWTPWRTIRTAPESTAQAFRFLYMGDAQCGLEGWGRLLKDALKRTPDAAFILMAGDLVDRGNERTNWDHFFLRAEGVFDRLPLMPCAGNHEYLDRGPWLYSSFFELPRNGPSGTLPKLVYSFEYGDAFFAILDSTPASVDENHALAQAEWLDAALSQTRATWRFVMFHHPVYASHPSRENPIVRETWVPVFDRHHVDLVLQGHDHAYLRTYPMNSGRAVSTSAQGTTYVVAVAGDKYCEQNPRDYTAAGFTNVSTYQTIAVDPARNRLTYQSWNAEGREVDRFEIQKPAAIANGAAGTAAPR